METKIFKTDEKNIIVEKNVYKGYGIAHFDSNTIFVEKAVEGDELKVKILYKKAKSLFAKPIKIIKKSKYRNNDIFCSAFYECGGCDWLNIKYSHQLEIKKRIIKELYDLKKIDIVESSYKYHYRNKNFLPVAMENNKPVIGIYKKGSHKVIPHKKCFLTPEIFDNLAHEFFSQIKFLRIGHFVLYLQSLRWRIKLFCHIFSFRFICNMTMLILTFLRRTLGFLDIFCRIIFIFFICN